MSRLTDKFGKPTLAKSLKNGFWYCGIGVRQTQRPCAHIDVPPCVQYGKGSTPDQAYDKWHRAVDRLYRLMEEQQATRRAVPKRPTNVWRFPRG